MLRLRPATAALAAALCGALAAPATAGGLFHKEKTERAHVHAHAARAAHTHGRGSRECHACAPGVHTYTYEDHPGDGFKAEKHPYLPADHTMERAGFPRCISEHAEPSYNGGYVGYYVGGGAHGHKGFYPNRSCEGTFGWDYDGHSWIRHNVVLGFSRGRLYQGGMGQYYPEYPFEIPNPLVQVESPEMLLEKHHEVEGGEGGEGGE